MKILKYILAILIIIPFIIAYILAYGMDWISWNIRKGKLKIKTFIRPGESN